MAEGSGAATKLAGTFETPEALKQGLVEIHKKLFGDDAAIPTYADVAAEEKAYKALHSTLGKVTAPPKKEDPPVIKPGEDPLKIGAELDIGDDADLDAVLKKAGLNGPDLATQWKKDGKLTDEQYAALKKVGYPPKIANTVMEGEVAKAENMIRVRLDIRSKGAAVVGGEAQLKNLDSWAAANMPKERLESLRKMVAADPAVYPEVISLMASAHKEAVGAGKATALITGDSGGAPSYPKNAKELADLQRRAFSGEDEAAARMFHAMPIEVINKIQPS